MVELFLKLLLQPIELFLKLKELFLYRYCSAVPEVLELSCSLGDIPQSDYAAGLFLKSVAILTARGTVPEASGSVLTSGRVFPESSKDVPVATKAVPNTYICTYIYGKSYEKMCQTSTNMEPKMEKKCAALLQKCAIFLQKCVILLQKCAILLRKCAILPQIV